MAGSRRFLVLDACVLIDFVEADPSVLQVIGDHLAPIAVTRPVFDEVEDLDEDEAEELGLEIVEVDLALAVEAAAPRGALSFEDRLCLLLASRESWICVTNDGALRRACQQESVAVLWGLELVLELVKVGGLGKKDAETLATSIHGQNPHYVSSKILAGFLAKLKRL